MLGELLREALRSSVGEVDPEFAHDVYDLGVDVSAWVGFASRGKRAVAAVGKVLEQSGAHLRASGVVQADEQDRAISQPPLV